MPIAARKPQQSNPVNSIIILDHVSIDDVLFDIKSKREFSVHDYLLIEDKIAAIGFSLNFETTSELSIEDKLFHFKLVQIAALDELAIDVVQNFTEQYIETEPESADPSDVVGRMENLEADFTFSSVHPGYYKEFNYDAGQLTGYSIYVDASKNTKLFDISLVTTNGVLTEKRVRRISDNRILSVLFSYADDVMIGQHRVIL